MEREEESGERRAGDDSGDRDGTCSLVLHDGMQCGCRMFPPFRGWLTMEELAAAVARVERGAEPAG